jgi:phosphate/sulfate permease
LEKILTSMAWLDIPVSTTQSVSGAIMGVDATTSYQLFVEAVENE